MKYIDGLNCLDQLKDYVQTSLSSRQNVQQSLIEQKIEENEDVEQIEDPLMFREIVEEIKSEEITKEVKASEDLDLNFTVKEEIFDEGEKLMGLKKRFLS